MSEEDLTKARSVPVLRYAAADIIRRHATELAKSAIAPAIIDLSPPKEEEVKIEDQKPADSPRSESSESETEPQKENLFDNMTGVSLTQSNPIPIATTQDIIRLSDSLSSSAPESYNDSSPISLSTLSTRQRSHSTGTAISQDELERRVLFDAFSANKGAGAEKLHKFFGMPIAFESFVSVAPQPRHVKEYKMKKIFGEEIPIEHRQAIKRSMDDEDARYMNDSQKHRRVGKFFGESLDVSQPSSLQEPFGLSRRVSRMLQPEHVDVTKLNKFFGRPTYIQKEKDDDEGQEEEDSSAMERHQIQQQIKKSRKLRNYFGESQPVLDPNAKQFAPQPAHVKGYKLSKHFGCHVVIEHGTDSKSNTNSPTESMMNSNNSNITTGDQSDNVEGDEPVVKRELLLLLPERTVDSSPRIVSASDGGTRSARKAGKILGEPLTPSTKKELSNSHREPLYKEGKKSHREKDKDKDKNKEHLEDEPKEPKEHKEKEKKKKDDK